MPVDPWGFTKHRRTDPPKRPVEERLRDWQPAYRRPDLAQVRDQAARCMGCGVPFCHAACPLGNLVPDWTELIGEDSWRRAADRLHETNNFPEFTGWLCPAPCEEACVLALADEPVAIKQVELAIIDRAWECGWVRPLVPDRHTGRSVAVVGSGPAGLAAAQQLTRAGHTVVVYERADTPGGLLRYGIPDFKLRKHHIDRRLAQMRAEGTRFAVGVDVGRPPVTVDVLRSRYDAVLLAVGALVPREVDCPGRDLGGVVQAMSYLPQANRAVAGGPPVRIDARGRNVVVIGGGDTAVDCLGTANRQGARSVTLVDHNPAPPERRDAAADPWPHWPRRRRTTPAHEEGVTQLWGAEAVRFLSAGRAGGAGGRVGGDGSDGAGRGAVRAVRVSSVRQRDDDGVRVFEPVPDTERDLPAQLVLLAAGFVGTGADELLADLGVRVSGDRATVDVDDAWATTTDRVWACGDAIRGASLVVWAIADGRSAAAAVDRALTGEARLPAVVGPRDRPL